MHFGNELASQIVTLTDINHNIDFRVVTAYLSGISLTELEETISLGL